MWTQYERFAICVYVIVSFAKLYNRMRMRCVCISHMKMRDNNTRCIFFFCLYLAHKQCIANLLIHFNIVMVSIFGVRDRFDVARLEQQCVRATKHLFTFTLYYTEMICCLVVSNKLHSL